MDGWMVSWVHVCTVARTRSHSLTLHRFPGLWLARRSVWGLVSCSQWQREGERDRKVTDQLCLRWFEQGAQCSDIWRIRYFYVVFFLLVFFFSSSSLPSTAAVSLSDHRTSPCGLKLPRLSSGERFQPGLIYYWPGPSLSVWAPRAGGDTDSGQVCSFRRGSTEPQLLPLLLLLLQALRLCV